MATLHVRQRELNDGRIRATFTYGDERVSATGTPEFVRRALQPVMQGWGFDIELGTDRSKPPLTALLPGQEQLDDIGEAPANGSGPVSTFD